VFQAGVFLILQVPRFMTARAAAKIALVQDGPTDRGFKARLDGALNTLIWWKMSLPMARWLEQGDL